MIYSFSTNLSPNLNQNPHTALALSCILCMDDRDDRDDMFCFGIIAQKQSHVVIPLSLL